MELVQILEKLEPDLSLLCNSILLIIQRKEFDVDTFRMLFQTLF